MSSKSFIFPLHGWGPRHGTHTERSVKIGFGADFLVNLKIVIMIDDAFAVINDAVIVMSI